MSEETVCDNTSVGIIARDDSGRILLIERKKIPFGWAPPAGHCDGASYGITAFKEFEEEVGLRIIGAPKSLVLKNPRKYFKCRRGGEYHDWQIFEVSWEGSLVPSVVETNGARWYTTEEMKVLADKTAKYLYRMKLAEKAEEPSWTKGIQKSIEKEWQASHGLEPVWCEFFHELGII